jgi:hypothetical protein
MTNYFYTYELEKHEYYKFLKFLRKLEPYRSMSVDAKYIYTLMLDRMGLSIKNGWHDTDGKAYIYFTRQEIEFDLNCSSQKSTAVIRELIKYELLEEKRQGINKPNKLFLKQIDIKVTNQKSRKPLDLTSDNHYSKIEEITNQKSRKSLGIKTDINKTDINKTDINNKDSVDFLNPPISPLNNSIKSSPKEEKITFSEVVQLTTKQHQKLIEEYGQELTDLNIENLNNYIQSTGKKYKSHYHTILTWIKKDNNKISKNKFEKKYKENDENNFEGTGMSKQAWEEWQEIYNNN